MADDSSGEDRRRWPRAPLHGEVLGQIYTEAAAPILDLSEGGALVEVPCVLRPRSLYTLRITLDDGRVLALRASVVRSYVHELEAVQAGEARVRYRAAMQFTEMSDEDRTLLGGRIPGRSSSAEAVGVASDEQAPGRVVPAFEPTAEDPPPDLPPFESEPLASTDGGAGPTSGAASHEADELVLVPAPELLADELEVTLVPMDVAEEPPQPPAQESPTSPPSESHEPVPLARPGLWSRVRGWLSPPASPEGPGMLPGLLSPPERRDSSRVPLEGEVQGKMSLHLQSDVMSLSEGGMMVRMPFAPVTGSVVGFTVDVGGRPLPLRGTVRNVKEEGDSEGNPLYMVGVEFVGLEDGARHELETYLSQRLET